MILMNALIVLMSTWKAKSNPAATAEFRRRIRIVDFASTDVITEFNLLVRLPGVEPDSFAGHQVDLLLDVIPDGDALKLCSRLGADLFGTGNRGVDPPSPLVETLRRQLGALFAINARRAQEPIDRTVVIGYSLPTRIPDPVGTSRNF